MDNTAVRVQDTHVGSSRRVSIHQDICRFVTETFAIGFAEAQKDLALENFIYLTRRYCFRD